MKKKVINDQGELERLLVDELRKRGALEDVICEYGIETVRECTCCHRLLHEGWMYDGRETFCSTECLLTMYPDENLRELEDEKVFARSDTYWTTWEG